MKLDELFISLALGELANSSYVELNQLELNKNQLNRVINAINQGLTLIHTHLPLRHNQIVIQLHDNIGTYYLDSRYAKSNTVSTAAVKFILDTPSNPFKDDILNIIGVYNLEGQQYPLNDQYAIGSLFTPDYNSLMVPLAMWQNHKVPYNVVDKLVLVYQADHPKIPLNEPLTSQMEIHLSPIYQSMLQAYVAHLLHMHIGSEQSINQSNQYFAKFNSLMQTAKEQGIGVITQTGINIKPILRDFI